MQSLSKPSSEKKVLTLINTDSQTDQPNPISSSQTQTDQTPSQQDHETQTPQAQQQTTSTQTTPTPLLSQPIQTESTLFESVETQTV